MSEDDVLGRRRPLYAYLEPLISGRHVLEIAREGTPGTELLTSLGAARVMVLDGDGGAAVKDRYDLVLVPDGGQLARRPGAVATLRKLLSPGGRLVLAATNADRPSATDGLGYYELRDALTPHFPRVQMFAATPFLGMGVVEFDGAVEGLRIDARLLKDGSESPSAYVAIAGAEPATGLGYALVQLPFASLEARLAAGPAPSLSASPSAALLREEVDELRARLRRAAEDRAALDAEAAKLRRALAEADESVLALTRRTAEEMAAVTERLTGGARFSAEPGDFNRVRVQLAEMESRAIAAERRLEEIGGEARNREQALEDAVERLRLANDELQRARRAAARFEERALASAADAQGIAARDRAIAERDERIAILEGEKQELRWRLAELEDRLRDAIARAVRIDNGRVAGPPPPRAPARPQPAGDEGDAGRERALADFHRAASAHVAELTELKASVAEQSALVTELEDAVQAAETRAQTASAEASSLRKTAKDLEEADRARRSRLAELEGKLIRLEHERRAAAGGAADELDGQLRTLQAERDALSRRAAQAEEERAVWAREREALRASIEELKQAAGARNGHGQGNGQGNGHDAAAANITRQLDAIDEATLRLESTLGNYRERAGRLRDELEGIRRRLDTLSPSEIAGFLEELGEDLAELEK